MNKQCKLMQMWVCQVQKKAAGSDYKLVYMGENKWHNTDRILSKLFFWSVALQSTYLEI